MLQQITKPVGMKLSDWKLTRTKAETIKDQHFTGQPWSTKLFIGSKSFYKMITDENGQLLISDKATLKFAKNKDIENWFYELLKNTRAKIQSNNFSSAIKSLDLLNKIKKNNKEVMLLGAYVKYTTNKNHEAWSLLCKTIALFPMFDKAYFLRAQLLQKIGKTEQALEDLSLCINYSNEKSIPVSSTIKVLIQENENARALRMIEKHKIVFTGTSQIIKLADLYLQMNKITEAKDLLFNQLVKKQKSADLHLAIGKLAVHLNQTELIWKHLYQAKNLGNTEGAKLYTQLKNYGELKVAA